ncbi:energy-coupling factor ABC transporter ATP-binding protein [Lacticaseibacillus nasuensis]|uniref:energy-coupling factor ABC transporter ATP-binding protein n=1 Tax=Lacticaseibacillus nasuensis TaxID=944671 RepID=UPI0022481AA0|nr:ABC transporter ATP-binding protein [Lacticaseibacillus nasuensis]MCX2456021.1 energy-coupling factor ABC transporter ATP-binding protein [Lacticaseibacillus nasuensis]
MKFIEVQGLSFDYPNGYRALNRINMTVDKGESVAIIGQNGAGKTTFVKMLNGLLKPSEGQVIVDGWNTTEHSTAELSHKVGYVFQNPDDQIFHSNVYDEIAFAPRTQKLEEDAVDQIVQQVATVCGLDRALDDNPYDLPYSVRKFVAIASVMALNPSMIILDEPTAGQDKRGMQIIENIINHLIDGGKSVITITHDMEFTVRNFKRVIVMAQTKKIAEGTPGEIFWNFDVLTQAKLMQPYVSRVARETGVNGQVTNISGFVDTFKQEQ